MLSTNLSREECDKENVHELLLLLKRNNSNQIDDNSKLQNKNGMKLRRKLRRAVRHPQLQNEIIPRLIVHCFVKE